MSSLPLEERSGSKGAYCTPRHVIKEGGIPIQRAATRRVANTDAVDLLTRGAAARHAKCGDTDLPIAPYTGLWPPTARPGVSTANACCRTASIAQTNVRPRTA